MGNVFCSVEELVGRTPLVKLNKLMNKLGLHAELLAKCEFYNPIFSLKDRVALNMINKAPFSKISSDTVFIEATYGDMGVALSAFCAYKGYKLIVVMPDDVAEDKVNLIRHFGAEVMLTPAADGLDGAIGKVKILKQRSDNLIEFNQLENPANIEAHQLNTGTEILKDTDGNLDAIVCCTNTAGTLIGVASTLLSCNPDLYVLAVAGDRNLEMAANHEIKSINSVDVAHFYRPELVNEIYQVSAEDCLAMVKAVAETEGLPIGISSAAAICAAVNLAHRDEMEGKSIVAILPDSIMADISNPFFYKIQQD